MPDRNKPTNNSTIEDLGDEQPVRGNQELNLSLFPMDDAEEFTDLDESDLIIEDPFSTGYNESVAQVEVATTRPRTKKTFG